MIDLRFYWSLLMRRLPVMLAILIICSAFGAVWAIRAPSTYSANARLLVEGAQIVDGRDMVTPPAQTLQIIEQQLMTRANMIDVANKLNVFGQSSDMDVGVRVAQMMSNTSVRRSSGRDQATLMTVGFTSTSPRLAAAVVNEYTTIILSANTRNRVELAEDRLSFYQQEVDRLGQDLDLQTTKILEFKRENSDALPENLRYRQDRQSLLQERVSRLESDIAALRAQRADMVRIFEQTGSIGVNTATPQTPAQQQLARLRAELAAMSGVYSENSPRISSLRNRIAAAERAVQAEGGGEAGENQTGSALLDMNLAQIDSRLQAMETEMGQTNQEMGQLAESINATAANSITLAALERDQANIQARYNTAVASLGQARTAERVEASSRGQRITVIEAATVPSLPSGPNRKKLAAMGVGLGLALAGGFFALMELVNNSIRRPSELRSRFDITPLAVIPYIESRQERRRRQSVAMASILAVLIVIPLGLWALHVNYMPLDILAQKIVSRLGLG